MYRTHYYTMHKNCPCQMGTEAITKAKELFQKSSSTASFIQEMEKHRVIGKRITYDEQLNAIYIHKKPAIESGGGCPENKNLIGTCCHCDHYNHTTEYYPKYYCACGAEFYRPMFAPLFGSNIQIEPYKTVLSGDSECIITVKTPEKEPKQYDT